MKLCIELDEETYKTWVEIVEYGNRKFNDDKTVEYIISLVLAAIASNKHLILDMIDHYSSPHTFAR